jgi:hypothetical protein
MPTLEFRISGARIVAVRILRVQSNTEASVGNSDAKLVGCLDMYQNQGSDTMSADILETTSSVIRRK